MISKLAPMALPLALLAACAPMPNTQSVPTPQPAAAPAPPPAPEPPVSTAPIPIRSLSCAELLGAGDDDRAAASMFFIGYRAALAHVRGLSISEIQAIEQQALTICAGQPAMTASRAFATAVVTRGQ